MKKKVWKQALSMVFCLLFFFGTITVQAEEDIKHSTVDYDALFLNANQIYIGNEKAVAWEVGDKYFLHYTVTDVTEDGTNQSGMVVTKDHTHAFPYEKGGMYFGDKVSITEEGWTYLFRFEVTETGLKYVAGKAKGTESSYIQFPLTTGEIKTKGSHFGVWIAGTDGGKLTANLKHMRCYDEDGNDLGIYAPKAAKIDVSEMNPLDVDHNYSFSVENVGCLAFGNARFTKSDVVMLEYTISNVQTTTGVTQSGAEFTNAPKAYYPHQDDMGYLNFDVNNKKNPTKMVTEGARYLARFERQKDGFYVMVKRTQTNGAVDYFSFTETAGKYSKDYGYAVMWIGEECGLTADFTNVKCYDGEGNNLAVQTNKDVEITHYGDLEDYTQCVADYYCKKNKTIITLGQDNDMTIKALGENDETQGTYSVGNGVLKLNIEDENKEWTYAYEYIKDTEGNKYMRLRENVVTFKSQGINGEVLSTAVVSADTGWKVTKPADPTDGNGNFTGWVDGSGKEYDFDAIVTEATTIYATWDGEQEWDVMKSILGGLDTEVFISVATSILLVGGTVAGSILFVRKRGRGWK